MEQRGERIVEFAQAQFAGVEFCCPRSDRTLGQRGFDLCDLLQEIAVAGRQQLLRRLADTRPDPGAGNMRRLLPRRGERDRAAALRRTLGIGDDPKRDQLLDRPGDAGLAGPGHLGQLPDGQRPSAQGGEHGHVARLQRQAGIGDHAGGPGLHPFGQPFEPRGQERGAHFGNHVLHRGSP